MTPGQSRLEWRTSSRSGSNGECVEIRSDLSALRDSKNRLGPALSANLSVFIAVVKTGTFDR